MARIFLVIHLCFRASLCNTTLQLCPGRGGIYFIIPWILSGLLTCFGNKIQQNQQRTSLRMFPHSPWEPSGCGLVNEPGLAGWMTGHVETGRHHRIRQQSGRQVEEAVLERPAPADHYRHLSTPAKTNEAWPMGSSVWNHTCGRNMYCFKAKCVWAILPSNRRLTDHSSDTLHLRSPDLSLPLHCLSHLHHPDFALWLDYIKSSDLSSLLPTSTHTYC